MGVKRLAVSTWASVCELARSSKAGKQILYVHTSGANWIRKM